MILNLKRLDKGSDASQSQESSIQQDESNQTSDQFGQEAMKGEPAPITLTRRKKTLFKQNTDDMSPRTKKKKKLVGNSKKRRKSSVKGVLRTSPTQSKAKLVESGDSQTHTTSDIQTDSSYVSTDSEEEEDETENSPQQPNESMDSRVIMDRSNITNQSVEESISNKLSHKLKISFQNSKAAKGNSSKDDTFDDLDDESPDAIRRKRVLFKRLNSKEIFGLTPKEISVKYNVHEELLLYLLPVCENTEMLEDILGYGQGRQPSKLVTTQWRSKKQQRVTVEQELQKYLQDKYDKQAKKEYWENQLSEHKQSIREYSRVYDDLYDYSRISIENGLKPLKEYYFNNPQHFNIRDPYLMEKAVQFHENIADKLEKYKENNERDRNLRKIFKEVEDQKRQLGNAQRQMTVEGAEAGKAAEEEQSPQRLAADLLQGGMANRKMKRPSKFARPGNNRNINKNIKLITLGDKQVPIDTDMADRENAKAVKQCQDNNQAYYMFKNRQLFPKKIGYSQAELEKQRNKQMVGAFKLLQQSVKIRNVRVKNNRRVGDPPLDYPQIKQQIQQKRKLRMMYNDLMVNTYLGGSDSDFSEHDSVSSDKVRYYEQKYNSMMKGESLLQKAKQEEAKEKRSRLDYVLYGGPKEARSTSQKFNKAVFFNRDSVSSERLLMKKLFTNTSRNKMNMPQRASEMPEIQNSTLRSNSNWMKLNPLRSYQNSHQNSTTKMSLRNTMQGFNNMAAKNHQKIEGILENLGDIYNMRKKLQSQMAHTSEISSAGQSSPDPTELTHLRSPNLLDQNTEYQIGEISLGEENQKARQSPRFQLNLPQIEKNNTSQPSLYPSHKAHGTSPFNRAGNTNRTQLPPHVQCNSEVKLPDNQMITGRSMDNMLDTTLDGSTVRKYSTSAVNVEQRTGNSMQVGHAQSFVKPSLVKKQHEAANVRFMKYIDDDIALPSGRLSDVTRNSMASMKKMNALAPGRSHDWRNKNIVPELSRHGHAKSMIESLKAISRKRSRVNFSELLERTKSKEEEVGFSKEQSETDRSKKTRKIETQSSYAKGVSKKNKAVFIQKQNKLNKYRYASSGYDLTGTNFATPVINFGGQVGPDHDDIQNDADLNNYTREDTAESSLINVLPSNAAKTDQTGSVKKRFAKESKEQSLNRYRKFQCQNIVNSCTFLEHEEKYENQPRQRELDKDQVLGEIRLVKQNDMFDILKEFDDANDPHTLKLMFIYRDIVDQEYNSEQRSVTKEYMKSVMNPLREVARIELKGNRQRKVAKVSEPVQ